MCHLSAFFSHVRSINLISFETGNDIFLYPQVVLVSGLDPSRAFSADPKTWQVHSFALRSALGSRAVDGLQDLPS